MLLSVGPSSQAVLQDPSTEAEMLLPLGPQVKEHFAPACWACYILAVCQTVSTVLKIHTVVSSQSGDCPAQGINTILYPKGADRRLLNFAWEILVRRALNFRNKDNWEGNLVQDFRSGKQKSTVTASVKQCCKEGFSQEGLQVLSVSKLSAFFSLVGVFCSLTKLP